MRPQRPTPLDAAIARLAAVRRPRREFGPPALRRHPAAPLPPAPRAAAQASRSKPDPAAADLAAQVTGPLPWWLRE